jgi:hypothetical protein
MRRRFVNEKDSQQSLLTKVFFNALREIWEEQN